MALNVSDRAPLIGLSTYKERAKTLVWDTEFALLHYPYVQTVAAAGGVAVLLPPQSEDVAGQLIERLDGLVLTGGADIDPARYNGAAQDEANYRPERDAWETALLRAALERDVPVLGVCRGLQIINVAFGGTLEQHVPARVSHNGHQPQPGRFGQVEVRVVEQTLLSKLIGTSAVVSCHHHQALLRVAPSLTTVARARDNTVEAAEDPSRDFVLGVQWHPEQDGTDLRLFAGLVHAAQRHAGADMAEATAAP